jgi:uncharacterized spore protein YtfJ
MLAGYAWHAGHRPLYQSRRQGLDRALRQPAAGRAKHEEEALDIDVENILAKAAENLSVRRAFGTAYEKDGMLIIPVALVAGGGGGGMGTARTRSGDSAARPGGPPGAGSAGQDAASQDSGQPDLGGGFGGLVLPSGAYIVKGDQVRWVPAVDATIVILASLSLVRVLGRTWARRRSRRLQPGADGRRSGQSR